MFTNILSCTIFFFKHQTTVREVVFFDSEEIQYEEAKTFSRCGAIIPVFTDSLYIPLQHFLGTDGLSDVKNANALKHH